MRFSTALACSLLATVLGCSTPVEAPVGAEEGLYPEIEPFRQGHLRVSDLHEIYYELSGNPEGIPVFGLHGGPGGASSPLLRRFTDPSRFLVVLHDQRGAGKSRPSMELQDNDTWTLVEDVERLRKELGLGKIVVFGGSWGTTLGLAYAEKYPEHVSALVLRGVFLGRQEEIDHFYHGGSAVHFPDAYATMLARLPDPERRPLPGYFYELITTMEGNARQRYCRAWAEYEANLAFLQIGDERRKDIETWLSRDDVCTFSLFENYYMMNGCFLEENQLLRDSHRLAGIPTYIVQGRYDVICPPSTAWDLHRSIPGSKLVIADAAGHSGSEPPIRRALLEFFREIADRETSLSSG
jgi:proline iminopeptidase